jgi:hypothetical protein
MRSPRGLRSETRPPAPHASRLEQGDALLARDRVELRDAGIAESTARRGHRAAKRLVVGRVGDELEIRHEVADFATVVEAHGADEAVRHAAPAECVLEGAALRVRAIQHRALVAGDPRARHAIHDGIGDEIGLVALVERAHAHDDLARWPRGAQRLAAPLGVPLDHRVGEARICGVER